MQERFNRLIDTCEPMAKGKSPKSGKPDEVGSSVEKAQPSGSGPVQSAAEQDGEAVNGGDSDYVSTTPRNSECGNFEFEGPILEPDPDDIEDVNAPMAPGAMIATGRTISELSKLINKGPYAVTFIFFDAIKIGDKEEIPLSQCLANAMSALPQPKVRKSRKSVTWFVEFAYSKSNSCSKVAQERGIPYIGFSRDVCNLTDPHYIEQIRMWAHERLELGELFHLWGSLPYTVWSSWQNLNDVVLSEAFTKNLSERRDESKHMMGNFADLTDLAVESGGSSSFEWPRYCSGWDEIEALSDMIVRYDMFSAFPCGCSFTLEIKGKFPKKPWRIVTTN